jgi:PAS domain S-box-containing protein/putative nucleotidyltransferase with HDIG domain
MHERPVFGYHRTDVNSPPRRSSRLPDWRNVFEHLDGAVVVTDLQGRVVLANAAAEAFATTPVEDIVGSVVWEVPEIAHVAAEVEARFAAAARGVPVEPMTLSLEGRDGESIVVQWRASVLAGPDGRATHVMITGRDITRQHEAEAALSERDARYRDAFERSDTVWWEVDLATGAATWPAAAEDFYGVDRKEQSHESWRSMLHPDDRAADEHLTRQMLEERWETFEAQNRILHPQKGVRWIRTHGRIVYSAEGEPLRLLGIDTDITERRVAEERLRASEASFRALADALPQIVWTALPDGSVDYFNKRYAEFTGMGQADGEAWGWKSIVHADDEAATVAAWQRAVASGTPYAIEFRIRRHDGAFRWFISRALPVTDDEGRVTRWFGTATDVHDQKAAALDLQRRTAQQAAVAQLGLAAMQSSDLEDLMRTALGVLSELLEAELCKVWRLTYREDEREFVLESAVGCPERWVGEVRVGAGADSQAGFTLATNAPVIVEDLATETRFTEPALLSDSGVVSGVSVVIQGTGVPYGVLGVHTTTRRTFDDADVAFVQSVANVLAEAVKRSDTEAALATRLRRLDALHTIDNAITDGTEMRATLRVIVQQIQQQLEVDAVAAFAFHDDLQTLEFVAGAGFLTDAIREYVPGLGEGRLGAAALERRIEHVADLREGDAGFVRPRLLAQERFVTYFAVPLVVKGELVGVLEIFHREPLHPDAGWHDFLTALGTQTAIAISNSRLFADLQVSNTKLRLAYDATIEGWGRALELKDNQTEGHSRRVTDLTLRLAKRLGVHDADLVHIRRGALLHDIGKMGIPDRILLKEGELDADEWEIMRSHPRLAYELLLQVDFLREALDIPYAHHERWDGSGYPRGLEGVEIPLAARIFAVADVYDALTSERPYWPAWTRQRALEYVRDQAGRHFAPDVAAEFVRMMSEATPDRPPRPRS